MRFLILLGVSVVILSSCRSSSVTASKQTDATPEFVSQFSAATYVRFICRDASNENPDDAFTTVEFKDPIDVGELIACFQFEPFDPNSSIHCMCSGEPQVEIFSGTQKIGAFSIHHGGSIRWEKHDTDLTLTESSRKKLAAFLVLHGIASP